MRKILKYEIKQLLRDKKTIILVFILPLVIMPLINGLLNKVINERIGDIFSGHTEFVSYDEPFLKDILTRFDGDSYFFGSLYSRRLSGRFPSRNISRGDILRFFRFCKNRNSGSKLFVQKGQAEFSGGLGK